MSVKSKIAFKGLYPEPQDVITEQATLALLDTQNVSTAPTEPLNSIQAILPRLNRHFKLETLKVIETALATYPDKVDKIVLYANSVNESELPLIFSIPTF